MSPSEPIDYKEMLKLYGAPGSLLCFVLFNFLIGNGIIPTTDKMEIKSLETQHSFKQELSEGLAPILLRLSAIETKLTELRLEVQEDKTYNARTFANKEDLQRLEDKVRDRGVCKGLPLEKPEMARVDKAWIESQGSIY